MKETPGIKYAIVFVIALVLWIGGAVVRNLASERKERREEVLREISASLPLNPLIESPFLRIPFTKVVYEKGLRREEKGVVEVPPKELSVIAEAKVEPRSRGLFTGNAFELAWKSQFNFTPSSESELRKKYNLDSSAYFSPPSIILPVAVLKSLRSLPKVKIGEREMEIKRCDGGFCVEFDAGYEKIRPLLGKISANHTYVGMESFTAHSNAGQTTLALTSNWPHPSFQGDALPGTREIKPDGFRASWDFMRSADEADRAAFGTRFVQPVDGYASTERSTKYCVLVIAAVFAAFMLIELLRKVRFHPLQYFLVGVSLVVFYLLVLSFSEHIGFGWAYFVSVVASVSLISFYISAALRDRAASWAVSSGLLAIYGALYVILSAEDYALLFGTSLVFVLLSAIMIVTRKIDWYRKTPGTDSVSV